jgi:hypothetical protein
MSAPATFQRLYRTGADIEHPATPVTVANVLNAMRGSVASEAPFRVLLRMDDGSMVRCSPKGWRT